MEKISNIIYFRDSDMDREESERGVLLCGKYTIEYEKNNNCLTISKNENYVNGFWGKNICDCLAVVGENGAGKTRLMNYIMEDIQGIKDSLLFEKDFIIIFERTSDRNIENTLLAYCTKKYKDIKILLDGVPIFKEILESNHTTKYLTGYQIAYFNNALSNRDYKARQRCRYDFSLGKMIKRHHDITCEMKYGGVEKDSFVTYYSNEAFRIINFLYDYANNDELKIDFRFPKIISIGFADDWEHKNYILNHDIWKKRGLTNQATEFGRAIDNITQIFGRNWITCLIKNLIFNCFKHICIPAVTPYNIATEYQAFFSTCDFLRYSDQIVGNNIYKCILGLLDELEKKLSSFNKPIYNEYISSVKRFVEWLEKNEKEIKQWENKAFLQIDIKIGRNTEAFINELRELYMNVYFEFPFLDFSFGVSEGEYCFLSIFSNLYSMVKHEEHNYNVYDYSKLDENTKGLLLIFDDADLAMHPRWQIMYMKWITDFCKVLFTDIFVKIIVTTHSPIILSDFPAHSVLYLQRDENGRRVFYNEQMTTFGSNIHSLFLNSFFLEKYGTMGAFAEKKINEVANVLIKENKEITNTDEIKKIIGYIGEGIIKQKLEEALYKNTHGNTAIINMQEREVLNDTMLKLKQQRNNLSCLIEELEGKLYDSN